MRAIGNGQPTLTHFFIESTSRSGFLHTALRPSALLPSTAHGQQVVDKMVATVNAGVLPECRQVCLITYSDLLWQLALQPNTPLDSPLQLNSTGLCVF